MQIYAVSLWLISLYNIAECSDKVIELSDADFDEHINNEEIIMVMFYAPWCGHCKNLKPEYEKAAEQLFSNDPPVRLARLDCTEKGVDVCTKQEIRGYPTLKIYKNGRIFKDYTGQRDSNGITKHMLAQIAPPSKELSDFEGLSRFLEGPDVTVVGFFETESDLKAVFLKLGDELRDKIKFGHTTNKTILDEYQANDDIVLFRPRHLHNKFEDNSVRFRDFAESQGVNEFIFRNYHGLVGHRTSDNINDFKIPLVIAYYGVDYIKNLKGTNYYRNRILKAAKDFKEQLTFAISSKDDFQQEINDFGVDVENTVLVLGRDERNKKYIMKEEFSVDSIKNFARNLIDHKLKPFLKSEPIPEVNDGLVKTAVGKNFNDMVINNGKDTMVKFYAPWCGHCKKLAPIFEDLAKKFEDEEVAFVEVDATENDVPDAFEIKGYPTIYWLRKYAKNKPMRYDGARELKDLIRFIAMEATYDLISVDRNGKKRKENVEL